LKSGKIKTEFKWKFVDRVGWLITVFKKIKTTKKQQKKIQRKVHVEVFKVNQKHWEFWDRVTGASILFDQAEHTRLSFAHCLETYFVTELTL